MRLPFLLFGLSMALSAQVTDQDLLNGPGENWLTYSGSYNGWRHSPLTQITPDNANTLVPK